MRRGASGSALSLDPEIKSECIRHGAAGSAGVEMADEIV
jgi:hypothetical protein